MDEWEPINTAPKDGNIIEVKGGTYGCEYSPCEFYNQPIKDTVLVYWNNQTNEWRNGENHYNPEMWRWPDIRQS